MITLLKVLAPFAILAGGIAGASWLNETAPTVPPQIPEAAIPLVEVLALQSAPHTLRVSSHGEAQPARRVQLVAELAARVIWVAPELESGDFVSAGTPLVRFDPTDYELARTSAEARLAQTEAALQLEVAEAEVAQADWAEHGEGPIPALVAREPQLARARADTRAAQAALDAALRDLERCEVLAPFDARVESRLVSVGSFVSPGIGLAALADSNTVEVEVPLRLADLQFLDLSLGQDPSPLAVDLQAQVAGNAAQWQGRVVRTGSSLTPGNRMVPVIVAVDQPYATEPPLVAGSFLRASFEGRRIESAMAVPRTALRDDDTVLLMDSENRLEIRAVEVLQRTETTALVTRGLHDGERLVLTPLVTIVPGMPLRTAQGE